MYLTVNANYEHSFQSNLFLICDSSIEPYEGLYKANYKVFKGTAHLKQHSY